MSLSPAYRWLGHLAMRVLATNLSMLSSTFEAKGNIWTGQSWGRACRRIFQIIFKEHGEEWRAECQTLHKRRPWHKWNPEPTPPNGMLLRQLPLKAWTRVLCSSYPRVQPTSQQRHCPCCQNLSTTVLDCWKEASTVAAISAHFADLSSGCLHPGSEVHYLVCNGLQCAMVFCTLYLSTFWWHKFWTSKRKLTL